MENERGPGGRLVEVADLIISSGGNLARPDDFLSRVLSEAGVEVFGDPLRPEAVQFPEAEELFRAVQSPASPQWRHYGRFVEVVAGPGGILPEMPQPGDILLRVAPGEPGLGHLALIAAPQLWRREELAGAGLTPEGPRPGRYVQVVEGGARPHGLGEGFARRLLDEAECLPDHQLLLRLRHRRLQSARLHPAGQSAKFLSQFTEEVAEAQGSPLPTRLDGIDIYQGNTGFPSFSEIARAGFAFVFHKASQYSADTKFAPRWPQIARAGMLRGAYHFFSHDAGSVAVQAERFGATVGRLVPGDLGPALDLEDRDPAHHAAFWAPRIQELADRIEARLGRQPIFYTSRSYWREFLEDDPGFGGYPLWVVWVNPGEPPLPAGWTKWRFWQWHFENSASPMPPPFAPSDRGVDLDRFNGTLYQLRGMADLGHTAPHLVGNQECIAYTETDGRIHLLEYVAGSWRDQDLFRAPFAHIIGTLPLAAGDPAAVALGNEQVIVYRSTNHGVHALTRILTDPEPQWHAVDITGGGGQAIGDPFVLLFENNVHVIYWDQFNDQVHVMRVKGVWQAESFMDRVVPNTPSQISGSATAYPHQNVLHSVSRSRTEGHLMDFAAPAGNAAPQDLTAAARGPGGVTPPGAAYRPATYTAAGKASRIVFRAVRGDIWQIERDTLIAKNLSLEAGHAPPAAGSPTAVFKDRAHVFYRTLDGTIIDMFDDAGVWRRRNVCAGAAADPTAFIDHRGRAAVTFRAANGSIGVARFINGAWKCEEATRPRSGVSGGSAPGGPEAAFTEQQREVSSPKGEVRWLKLFPDAKRSKADFLLDGDDYFTSVVRALETARTQYDYIYILGWMLDLDFELVKVDKDKTLFKLLKNAAERNVEIRILIWDNLIPKYAQLHADAVPRLNQLPNTRAFIDEHTFFPPKSKQLIQQIAPYIADLIRKYGHILTSPAARLEENFDVPASYILYRLLFLINQQTIGAHHEKVVIVKGEEGLIAFCGGIDFNKNRVISTLAEKKHGLGVTTPKAEFRFPYYHDTACRLQGPAALEVLQRFKRRWRNHPVAKKESLRGENEAQPKERPAPYPYTKVVGTYTRPDGREKDRSLSEAYLAIVENAQSYIYLEDQYLVNLDVARALNKKIKDPNFRKLTLAIQDSIETADILIPNRKRGEFLNAVLSGTTGAQKEKVLVAVIDRSSWDQEYYHPGMHAKTLIADDEIAIIGSANVNQRSFTVDSETSVIVFDDAAKVDRNFARVFRIVNWKHFLRKPVERIFYESWWNYPTLISQGRDKFSILIPYGKDLQDDLDLQIIDKIKSSGVVGVVAAKRLVGGGLLATQAALHPQTIVRIFDTLWEHFIDPQAG